MKVKITHTLDLNEVPQKVNDLIKPAKGQLEKSIKHLCSLDFLLSSSDTESISLSRTHLDVLRKELASVDALLQEAHGMISGVDDYNMQEVAKQAMEEELAKQEQERERELSQEFHGQEYVPEEVHDDKSL